MRLFILRLINDLYTSIFKPCPRREGGVQLLRVSAEGLPRLWERETPIEVTSHKTE
jgi:hypothetical protein